MSFTISTPGIVADMAALEDLMTEYYGVVLGKLRAAGGPPDLTPKDLMAMFRPSLHLYLPPTGCMTLVHDDGGRLIGSCMMSGVRPDASELKRIYVRPEAGGTGLGRRIMERQFEEARTRGWRTILINVIRGNAEMLRLSEKMGFRQIERYPECADPVELADFFVYLEANPG